MNILILNKTVVKKFEVIESDSRVLRDRTLRIVIEEDNFDDVVNIPLNLHIHPIRLTYPTVARTGDGYAAPELTLNVLDREGLTVTVSVDHPDYETFKATLLKLVN